MLSHDLILIKHELLEIDLKKNNPRLSRQEAHDLAKKEYNYFKDSGDYYDKRKERKKKTNNRLSADYFYQDPCDIGHVMIDVNTGEILQRQPNKEDNTRTYSYFGKVIQFLEMMIKADNYPESADFIWY